MRTEASKSIENRKQKRDGATKPHVFGDPMIWGRVYFRDRSDGKREFGLLVCGVEDPDGSAFGDLYRFGYKPLTVSTRVEEWAQWKLYEPGS